MMLIMMLTNYDAADDADDDDDSFPLWNANFQLKYQIIRGQNFQSIGQTPNTEIYGASKNIR